MKVDVHVQGLQAALTAIAAVGGEPTADAASRISVALEATLNLRLLQVLAEAAGELSAQLPSGRVETRLSGSDVELVYVGEEPEDVDLGGEADTARITLRLPDRIKADVERAAARDGSSTNTWLVRTIARALQAPTGARGQRRLTGYGRS